MALAKPAPGQAATEAAPKGAPTYPFESGFVSVLGHRIHYVSHGSGPPVLFVHGNPTSSYLWRNVLPHVAEQTGRRGIALDLLGFGRSDKPEEVPYSLELHARIIAGFVDALELKGVVLVADDWGGPLAMRDVVTRQERYQAVVLMETFLWTFTFKEDFEPKFRMPFRLMRGPLGFVFVQVFNLMMKQVIPEHCAITEEGMQHYLECVPTVRSRRAMLEFIRLNPLHGKPRQSVDFMEALRAGLPSLTLPLTWLKASPGVVPSEDYPPSLRKLTELQARIPHLVVQPFGPGHHFLAEENPARVVGLVVQAIAELAS